MRTLRSILFAGAALCALPSYAQLLQEVIVVASRIETPVRQVGAAVSVVSQEEMALRGYASMADLLRTQPGVAVSNSGGPGKATDLRIRGEEGYRTLVMIDGVDISDPTATQVGPQIQHLSAGSDVERVEILRGPQGFIYGADAGGVVNIITRTAQGFAGELLVEAGRYNSQKLQGFVAASDASLDAFVSYSQQSTDGFNAHVLDASNDRDGYENTTLHGKFGVRLNNAWRSQLVVRGTEGINEYDRCKGGSNDCRSDFTQNVAKLLFAYQGQAMTHSMAVAGTSTDRHNLAAGQPSFDTDGSKRKLEYVGSLEMNPAFALVWGGDAAREHINANSGHSGTRDQFGVFSEAQASVDDAFYLSAGCRYDEDEDFGDYLSARIAPAFIHTLDAGSSIKYRASWGTGFRAPSFSEIFYNRSDAAYAPAAEVELQEETSAGFDVGVEWYFTSGTTIKLGYFDQKIENELYFDRATFSGYLQGDGVSHSRGGELAFEWPLASSLTVSGNYTYNDTLTEGDQIRARRPRHLANLAVRAEAFSQTLRMLINLRAVKGAVNDIYRVGRVALDDYHVVDVSAHYQPASALTLFARVENAADKQYQEVTDYNAAERALYAGVKYAFQ